MNDTLTTRDGLVGNSPRYLDAISPPYQRYLRDDAGNVINLTGVQPSDFTVTFVNQSNPSITVAGAGTFSIVSPATQGLMSYQYGASDLATVGNWYIYVAVQLPREVAPRVFDPELLPVFTLPEASNPPGSATTLSRNLAFINLRDYCKIDGATDDSTGFTTAYQEAHTRGMALYHPGGTLVKGNDTLLPGVLILGAGAGISIFKLKDGANADLFSGQASLINLAATAGTGIDGTLFDLGLQGLTLDGNKAGQTGGPSYPLRFYGYRFILRDLEIVNGYNDGTLIDWNGTASRMEAAIENIRFHGNNGVGLRMGGPHDSRMGDLLSHNNGSHGFHFAPNAGGLLGANLHPYSLAQSVNAVGCLCEASSCSFVNCMFEGSDYAQFVALASNITINGGIIFGNTGYAGTGLKLGQISGQAPIPGQVNQSGGLTTSVGVSVCNINTILLNCTNGAIDFRNEFRNNITANIYQTAGTVLVSNHYPDGSDQLLINVSGLTNDHTWNTQGGIQLASSNSSAFVFSNASGTNIFDLDGNGKLFSLVNGAKMYGYSDNYTTPKFFLDGSQGTLQLNNASTFLSGSGAPSSGLGSNGDYYFRSDTPGTANQRIYVKSAGAWVGIV